MAAEPACSEDAMRDILKQFSLTRFDIEYEIFKSNHMLHAVVALHRLGATYEQMLKFAEDYGSRLEPVKPSEGTLVGEEWRSLLGKRTRLIDLQNFFRAEVEKQGDLAAIAHYVPQLTDGGISCEAFHPIIHIGYGVMGKSAEDIADGLAYLVFGFTPSHPERHDDAIMQRINNKDAPRLPRFVSPPHQDINTDGLLSHPVLSLLSKIRNDVKLQRLVTILRERIQDRKAEIVHETGQGAFSNSLYMVQDHALDDITRHVDESGLFNGVTDDAQLSKLFDTVIQGILILFASTAKEDDFFLLHGVTSSWALRETLPHLPDFAARRKAVYIYCRDVIVAFVIQNMPQVVPWSVPDVMPTWHEIRQAAVVDSDEHLIKVVMTCDRAEQEFGEFLLGQRVYRAVAAFKSGLLPWPRSQQ